MKSDKIPIFETALKVFVDLNRVNVFDKREVFPWNAVFDTWWSDQTFVRFTVA